MLFKTTKKKTFYPYNTLSNIELSINNLLKKFSFKLIFFKMKKKTFYFFYFENFDEEKKNEKTNVKVSKKHRVKNKINLKFMSGVVL